MAEAYIVDAIRTPVGKRNGSLSQVHPADLGAHVLKAIVERNKLDPVVVEDVIFGCLDQLGPNAGDIARTAWLAAGFTDEVPGTTIDRQCGSSQQAIHFAAQGVMSGTQDVVIAGGVQNMSLVPMGSSWVAMKDLGQATPFSGSKGWQARYGDKPVSQFYGAEMIAAKWNISRLDMEKFAFQSHQRAIKAIEEGRFNREIVPFGEFKVDEGPRRDTSMEKLATLKTLSPDGRMTAAVASQISDGASAVLVVSEKALKQFNLKPRARIHHMSVRGADPIFMLTAPIPATKRALQKTGLKISDIDRVEINEAFAPVVLAWAHDLEADLSKVNVSGGAIALGHPLGATGAKLMATLLNELERTNGRYGLQTMCEGGGQANVTIIERL
jgi:acetyl-CoA C-acetyltransferase